MIYTVGDDYVTAINDHSGCTGSVGESAIVYVFTISEPMEIGISIESMSILDSNRIEFQFHHGNW